MLSCALVCQEVIALTANVEIAVDVAVVVGVLVEEHHSRGRPENVGQGARREGDGVHLARKAVVGRIIALESEIDLKEVEVLVGECARGVDREHGLVGLGQPVESGQVRRVGDLDVYRGCGG